MCPNKSNGQHLGKKLSHFDFQKAFSNMSTRRINTPSGPRHVTEFTGVRNLPELKQLFQGKYLRRTAEEVLDLPAISSKEVILPEDKSSRELEQAWKDHEANTGEPAHIATCKKESAVSKAKATVSYALDILENGESVVIFSDHIQSVGDIALGLSRAKICVGYITGSVSPEDRAKLVARFQAGLLEALVCTIPAASTGITLTAARHLIFNDLSWSSTENEQASKRIHRISQERKSFIHFMLRGKIDRLIKKRVIQKAVLLKEVL
jgi:SWI/SNF-related matrix-associated actin-dependent regulator 1 of chromatin subfamily A